MPIHINAFLIITLLLSLAANQAVAAPPDEVRRELAELREFVGAGDNGQRWHKYLRTSELEAQLEQEDDADPEVVAGVIAQYRSGAGGLDQPQFQAVRAALEEWQAELLMPTREELPEFAAQQQDEFRPKTEADVQAAARQVQQAKAALARFVGPGRNGNAWRTYLGWEALDRELAAEQPDMAQLEQVVDQLNADIAGVELPQFTRLRSALRRYIDTHQVATNPKVREAFGEQIKVLADALREYEANPSREAAQQIAGRVGWFERMDQAPVLVEAVRRYYSHPNFYGYASEELLKAAMQRPIARTTNITDNFQGTRIVGTGRTSGNTVIELVPNEEKISFDILFYGHTISNTRGYNSGVTVNTTGNTAISARKRIFADQHGLSDLPATAAAVTRTRTDGINSGGGLFSGAVQREAWSRVSSSRSAAESHGSERAKQQMRSQVDQQARQFIADGNARFEEKFRAPLVRRQAFPSVLKMSTTADEIQVEALQASSSQIAAPSEPPPLQGRGDLGFRMHDSLVNNAAAVLYAGRRLTEEESNDFMTRVLGEIPEEFQAPEDAEPWAITFARQNPILVSFEDDNRVSLVLSGRKYESGDRVFGAMDVKASYQLVPENGKLFLKRDGELRIEPPGFDPESSRLSSSQVTLRTLLKKRFEKILKEAIEVEPFELPGELARAGKLGVDQATTSGGWLAVEINRLGRNIPAGATARSSAE